MTTDLAVRFLVAAPGQVDEVLAVLDEASAWLQERGVEQWPSRFEPSWVEGAVSRGETWLALAGGTVSGTVTLARLPTLYGTACPAPPPCTFTGWPCAARHRASARSSWDGRPASQRQQGREALRLDCVAANGRLRAYYEAAGFVHRGDVTVAGAPGQRLDEGPVTVVSRYEQPLGQVP